MSFCILVFRFFLNKATIMKETYQINRIYSIILMIAGAFGFLARYYESGDWQFTALIPFVFGIILLLCTKGIKKENAVIGHIAALLTTLLIITSAIMLLKDIFGDFDWGRKQWIFLIVILGGIWNLRSQINYFRLQRKRKANNSH